MLISSNCFATTVTVPTVWSTNDTVTNVKLNSNNNAITNVLNGGLDNTNANTTGGYFFFQKVAALPSAGTQGSTYFLTTDNSLNLDTGSAFAKTITITSPSNGDMPYYNSGWNKLSVSATTGTPIISNGTLPVYGQITAASSVSTTALTGSLFGSWVSKTPGTIYQALTDGFVICNNGQGQKQTTILSDSAATPATLRCDNNPGSVNEYGGCFSPVRKNDYYQCNVNGGTNSFEFFISIGT